MAHIIVREPGRVTYSAPLHDGLRAGRHDANDLVLADKMVSRDHLKFLAVPDGFAVVDLGSTHGVTVNGERVNTQRALKDGDRIEIGKSALTFCERDEDAVGEIVQPRGGAADAQALPFAEHDDMRFAEHDDELAAVHRQVTEIQPLLKSRPEGEARRLRLFYEVSRAFGALGNSDVLLGEMLDTIIDVLDCERGVVGLLDGTRGGPRRIARVRGRGEVAEDDVVVSRAFLDAMLVKREGRILPDLKRPETPHTMVQHRVQSAMGAPIAAGERVLGFVYVDDRGRANRFRGDDLDFLTALAHLTAAALEGAEQFQRATATAEALREGTVADEIIGASEPMVRLKAQIQKYARAEGAHVLIRGESGSGKELVARTIHALSPRADDPFVALNCAAIPDTMIESELFGHEKGAFTGAVKERRGKFTLANRGTLFLDEIGDLSLSAQAKVLRAIEEGELQPLGSEKTVRVDVRIVSATHKNLLREVGEGKFREDLYYRLNVIEIEVPPVRERGGDVVLLAGAFLARAGVRMGKRLAGFTKAAEDALRRYGWPGNVRELQNEVERAAIVADGPVVDVPDLSPRVVAVRSAEQAPGRTLTLAEQFAALEPTERRLVDEALKASRGNVSEAARLLGITRIMIQRRIERFGINAE